MLGAFKPPAYHNIFKHHHLLCVNTTGLGGHDLNDKPMGNDCIGVTELHNNKGRGSFMFTTVFSWLAGFKLTPRWPKAPPRSGQEGVKDFGKIRWGFRPSRGSKIFKVQRSGDRKLRCEASKYLRSEMLGFNTPSGSANHA